MPPSETRLQVGDPVLYAHRLRALFDALPALISFWDGEGRNVMANAAFDSWYGMTPGQIRGMHLRDVFGVERYEQDLPFITRALGGVEQVFERDLVDSAGRERHTQTTYLPDMIEGEIPGLFAIDADITLWVEATRTLDEAQKLAQLGSSIHDPSNDVVVWTDELYRIFGEDPELFNPTEETLASRVHPDDVERLRSAQENSRSNGREYDCTYRIVLPDGSIREVRGRTAPVKHNGEKSDRLVGTVQDLTDINAAARELARLNSELSRINEVNADVLAMLGHDVRTPLIVISGNLELLIEDWSSKTEDERLERVERIQAATQRMEVLVEDILAMAAADAGQLSPNLAEVNLADAVREALGSISADGVVQSSVSAELHVVVDPFHLRQIVSNLITNAFRYGAPPVEVTADPDRDGAITLRVRDHGPGVATEVLAGLFKRFGKSGTSNVGTSIAPGAGFGLYSASRMAGLNHGTLVYEPEETGACFALTLPGAFTDEG